MSQWIDDEKSAYNLIHYSDLRCNKNRWIQKKSWNLKQNQSIHRERDIIAKIRRIFAAESMKRKYKIDGLPFEVGLCFVVHKFIVEIDEDGHVYYDEEKHQIKKELT